MIRIIQLTLIILFLAFGQIVRATPFPSTLWSSSRIPETLHGLQVGPVMDGERDDIVVISQNHLIVYRIEDNKLSQLLDYKGERGDEWFKLNLYDLDGDGKKEIFISGFSYGRVMTLVGRIENNKFNKLVESPYYYHVLPWEKGEVLVAQKRLGKDDFTGSLMRMELKGGQLVQAGIIELPGGLSVQSIPLYSVEGLTLPDQQFGFLYLTESGKLIYYQKQSEKYTKQWTSGEEYGGSVIYLKQELKNALNEVENKRFFVPVAFRLNQFPWSLPTLKPAPPPVMTEQPVMKPVMKPVMTEEDISSLDEKEEKVEVMSSPKPPDVPEVYVIKNTGYLKNVIGAVPSIKNTQIVRVKWTGYGFQEAWNSPRLDGAITDFVLVDWDHDGKAEILATFLLRDKGYVDTLKKQDSLLIVLKP